MGSFEQPEKEAGDQRRFPRYSPRGFEVLVRVAAHPAELMNLSLLGGLVELDRDLAAGSVQPVELSFQERSAVLKALVRRAEPTCILEAGVDPQVRYQIALEFLKEPPGEIGFLEDLVTLLYYNHWVSTRGGRA